MKLIIDHATREKIRDQFGINNSDMTRVLSFQYNNIVARRARAAILNREEWHCVR